MILLFNETHVQKNGIENNLIPVWGHSDQFVSKHSDSEFELLLSTVYEAYTWGDVFSISLNHLVN